MVDPVEKKASPAFRFKQFSIEQEDCSMKVGTDGILLGAWTAVNDAERILDIGTGTGLIAMMLAQRSEANIHAVEVDEIASRQAALNFEKTPWSDRLEVFHDSIQDYARSYRRTYDLIVSNPPFFTGGVFSANQGRASVRHTVKLPNGDLLSAARNLLTKDGRFCVVLPMIEGMRFQEMANNYGLYCNKVTEVSPIKGKKANRMLMQFEKNEKVLAKDEFVVWEKEGQYSKAQIELTKDFYLDM